MCKKILESKVAEYGTGYGMGVYGDRELLSLATGIDPDAFPEKLEDAFKRPRRISGVGDKKELAILAIREIAKRLYQKPRTEIRRIHGPEDVAAFAAPVFAGEQKEHFAVMLLNTKNHILGIRKISTGSLTASIVHPREVFKEALLASAAAIILLHNHPSGDPSPSREDIAVTSILVKAGKINDIPVLDHVIIGDGRFVSLKERGLGDL